MQMVAVSKTAPWQLEISQKPRFESETNGKRLGRYESLARQMTRLVSSGSFVDERV
jgi:hypothetical protein